MFVRFVRNGSRDWNIYGDIIRPILANVYSVVRLSGVGNGLVGVII